jgi:hypothetical protein
MPTDYIARLKDMLTIKIYVCIVIKEKFSDFQLSLLRCKLEWIALKSWWRR